MLLTAKYDWVIVGAGPVGCVLAERLARGSGQKCLIIDKRSHLAGNCYDSTHSSGVLVHNYGPHYFRTHDEALYQYLSQFTEWIPGNYIVKSYISGKLIPFPINRKSLEIIFQKTLTSNQAEQLIEGVREKFEHPQNSEEMILSRVGRKIYETFYLNYTLKQWGLHPRELDASVGARIPIRFDDRESYVDHRFQVTPARGFTEMFKNMIHDPLISLSLNCDFKEVRHQIKPKKGLIYTGPLDEYFDYRLGRLPYRSLKFEFKHFEAEYVQPCVQINYPNDFEYTRSVEFKHVTGQKVDSTVLSYEVPSAIGDPYYPIPNLANEALFEQYRQMSLSAKNVYFCGRLAQYKYLNMDQAIESALRLYDQIQKDQQRAA